MHAPGCYEVLFKNIENKNWIASIFFFFKTPWDSYLSFWKGSWGMHYPQIEYQCITGMAVS